jgi:hypothetical protein
VNHERFERMLHEGLFDKHAAVVRAGRGKRNLNLRGRDPATGKRCYLYVGQNDDAGRALAGTLKERIRERRLAVREERRRRRGDVGVLISMATLARQLAAERLTQGDLPVRVYGRVVRRKVGSGC